MSTDPLQAWNAQAAEVGIQRQIQMLGREDTNRLEARLRAGEDITTAMEAIMGKAIEAQGAGFVDTVRRDQYNQKMGAFVLQQQQELRSFQDALKRELLGEQKGGVA